MADDAESMVPGRERSNDEPVVRRRRSARDTSGAFIREPPIRRRPRPAASER